MRAWILVHTTIEEAVKDGYTPWETDDMHAWYTKEGHPTLLPITGGLGYIKKARKAELLKEPGYHAFKEACLKVKAG